MSSAKDPHSDDRYDDLPADVAESMLRGLATSFVVTGAIDPRGMTEDQFHEAVAEKLGELVEQLHDNDDSDGSWLWVTLDHQDGLLEDARRFVAEDKLDHALVLYATWIEHWINWMLGWKFGKKGIEDTRALDQLVRFGLAQKLGVGWLLTFEEPLDSDLISKILKIADLRNGFVHYKWKPFDANRPPDALANRQANVDLAEEVIAELEEFRNQVAMGGAAQWLTAADRSFFVGDLSEEDGTIE